jgi:hypothetical protein
MCLQKGHQVLGIIGARRISTELKYTRSRDLTVAVDEVDLERMPGLILSGLNFEPFQSRGDVSADHSRLPSIFLAILV